MYVQATAIKKYAEDRVLITPSIAFSNSWHPLARAARDPTSVPLRVLAGNFCLLTRRFVQAAREYRCAADGGRS